MPRLVPSTAPELRRRTPGQPLLSGSRGLVVLVPWYYGPIVLYGAKPMRVASAAVRPMATEIRTASAWPFART